MSVRLSVCPIRWPHATVVGLLLWARRAGDIDRLLSSSHAAARRAAENAGSATLSADVGN